ncbi:hypothetical protein V6N11_071188 [Hibiscus sabdariffa]|uniref:Uncharacterized protein n=1 Tax=Hibiscus sabdariffa TaxID=183260 RepID=A0ABR2U064_9ROSI
MKRRLRAYLFSFNLFLDEKIQEAIYLFNSKIQRLRGTKPVAKSKRKEVTSRLAEEILERVLFMDTAEMEINCSFGNHIWLLT